MLSLFLHFSPGKVQLCPRRNNRFPIALLIIRRRCTFVPITVFLYDGDIALLPVYHLTSPINPQWSIRFFWKIYRRIESARLKSLDRVRRGMTLDEVTYHQDVLLRCGLTA